MKTTYSKRFPICRKTVLKITMIVCGAVVSFGNNVFAAGPSSVATIDRNLWPYPLSSNEGFDAASRLTILTFAQSIQTLDTISVEQLKLNLGLKSIDTVSLQSWKKNIFQHLIKNFNAASVNKGNGLGYFGAQIDSDRFKSASRSFPEQLPDELKNWYTAASQFSKVYCNEQARLAALSSKVSSEISVYSPAEVQGYDFPDKTFLLTFDDGPSVEGGSSDKLIARLRENNLSGVFFALGESLQKRLTATSVQKLSALYAGMNVQSHGMTHISHAKSVDWLQSVSSCNTLVDSVMTGEKGKPFLFRPPYGQRTPVAWDALGKIHGKIMLWNIDTQDWNAAISGEAAANRCLMLMLLWRRGTILFHDVHEKAIIAIPTIIDVTRNAGITWMDAGKSEF